MLVLFNFNINRLIAQWISSGPAGGYTRCIAQSGATMYAVTGQFTTGTSFYTSVDGGNSWTLVAGTTLPGDVRAMEISGSSVFLGTGSGLYRSDDNGLTWVEKTNGFPSGPKWINHLAVSGTTIFAAGTNEGLLRSMDNGENWTVVNNGLSDTYLYSLTANSSAIFAGTGDQMLGVFRSTDNGNSWQLASNGMEYYDSGIWYSGYAPVITAMKFAGTVLYAGTGESQGIWKSADNGDNWVFTGMETMDYSQITAINGNESVVFAGTLMGGGIIRSSDNGQTWFESNTGISNYGQVTTLLSSGGSFFAATQGGIFKTMNDGNSWSDSGSGIKAQNAVSPGLAKIGTEIFTGTENGGIFRSSDQGGTWEPVNNGLPINVWSLNALYSNNSALFAWDRVSLDNGETWEMANSYSPGATDSEFNGPRWLEHGDGWFAINNYSNPGVHRSMDEGDTWIPVNNGLPDPSSIIFLTIESNGTNLFLGTSAGIYYSMNNGDTWNQGSFPGFNSWAFYSSTFIASDFSDLFGLNGGGGLTGIYRSIDNGANWVQVHDLSVKKFVRSGIYIYASGTVLEIINGQEVIVPGIYLSEDDGLNWTKVSPFNDLSTPTLAVDSMKIFISRYSPTDNSVYCSIDNGDSWVNITDGMDPKTFVATLTIIGDKIFAGTNGKSVWSRNMAEFGPPAQPATINGPVEPCIGSTVVYSVTDVPGTSYTWQFPEGWTVIDGENTSSVTVIVDSTSGIVLVTPSNPFGTGPSQFLIVNPSPYLDVSVTIYADQNNVCEGTIITFTSDPVNGGDQPGYDWQVNSQSIGVYEPVLLYGPGNGDVISLIMTSSKPCTNQNPVESNSIVALITPKPVVEWNFFDPDTICDVWSPVALVGGTPEGGEYSGNGVVNNTFYPGEAGLGNHMITYTYTDENDCTNQDSLGLFVDICGGLPERNDSYSFYPNPVSDKLFVILNEDLKIEKISLFNIMGQQVYESNHMDGTGKILIDIKDFPSGYYFLRITGRLETFGESIIIE